MGKKYKKKVKKLGKYRHKKRDKKRNQGKEEQSKRDIFFKKLGKVFGISFLILLILNIILGIALDYGSTVSIEFYFIISYLVALYFLVSFSLMLYMFISKEKIWDRNDIKGTLTNLLATIFVLVLLILDLRYFAIPMSMDFPRIITGKYEETSGTIESIAYKVYHRKGSNKVQYVYVKEPTGKELKIEFEDGYPKIPQTVKKVYYLPHTLWGISAE